MRPRTGDRANLSDHPANEVSVPWPAPRHDHPSGSRGAPGPSESDEPSKDAVEASTESGDMRDSEETQTPDMIETAPPAPTATQSEPAGAAPARRATKFMADLSHAMQVAAEHAKNETMERFQAEAKAVVEEIHANATTEVVELRRKADDDVAAIRDWSKAEIARDSRGDRGARRRPQDRARFRDGSARRHRRGPSRPGDRRGGGLRGGDGRLLRTPERRGGPDPHRDHGRDDARPAQPRRGRRLDRVHPDTDRHGDPGLAGSLLRAPLATTEIDFAAAEAEALSFDGDLSALGDDDETGSEPPAESPESTSSRQPSHRSPSTRRPRSTPRPASSWPA